MASFLRSAMMIARASRQKTYAVRSSYQPARFASSTYGNSQSGHQKSDAPNPQVDKEHPGPEAPADQGKGKDNSSSTSGSSPESTTEGARSTPSSSTPEQSASDKSTDKTTSSGAKPALHRKDPADTDDPEVKKHNEDMRNRADQTPNQVK